MWITHLKIVLYSIVIVSKLTIFLHLKDSFLQSKRMNKDSFFDHLNM